MPFVPDALGSNPTEIRKVALPRRVPFRVDGAGNDVPYHPSPVDWAGQVLYFLLPDRFSDGLDGGRPLFDRAQPPGVARPAGFRWDQWAQSGSDRWQGGTLKGIASRLDYLAHLGISALWIGPVFKQRRHLDDYHGYAIQNFLEVDPHLGSRRDLVDLVIGAHGLGIRVILDVVFNHSGHNWDYAGGVVDPPYRAWPAFYDRGPWLDGTGAQAAAIGGDVETGVWPAELQEEADYTRAGKGSLATGDVDDDHAEMKRTDFDGSLRDFNFDGAATLSDLARCYKYWIALTDVDGMRLDTLKHVPRETARNFCGTIKEFAANLGKLDFFLVGEIAGGDDDAGRYLDALELNLDAALDIGGSRVTLTAVAKGLQPPSDYFDLMQPWDPVLGSHRNSAPRHVKVVDDHDHVFGRKVRFASDASSDHQACAAVAVQLLTLGIPCLYYGTEQGFAGPEKSEREAYLPDYGAADKYLRETMFGAPHPRGRGALGLQPGAAGLDAVLPGFGAFGTAGFHFFDESHPLYLRIQHLVRVRRTYAALSHGRQYLRPIRNFGAVFAAAPAGELIAWSRILDDEEIVCVVNGHGTERRGGDVLVDGSLNAGPGAAFTVVANTAHAAQGPAYVGSHPIGSRLPVRQGPPAWIELRDLEPSEAVVLLKEP